MKPSLDLSLSGSIRACRHLTALAHSSFVPAFALLPADKRQAMEILYAYTRFTDDLADLPDYSEGGSSVIISLRRRRQKLNQWIGALEAVLGKIGGENPPQVNSPPQIDPRDEQTFQKIAQNFPGCAGLVFLPALKMIVDTYNIPREPLFHLIDGIESDMEPKPFPTFDESADYCHQVATSVGFASLSILGTTRPLFSDSVVRAAKACGVAFQWTNIIRDLSEDYRNGRIYLPQSELERFCLTEKQFGSLLHMTEWNKQKKPPKKGEHHDPYDFTNRLREMDKLEDKFFKLLSYQLERCEVYYENSCPLYNMIHQDSRRTFGLMWNYYYALFRKIARHPLLVTKEKRVRLSSGKKIRLWLRWRFMPCRRLR